MSERVIAIKGRSFAGSRDIVLKTDPDAPSVAEIVAALREAMEWDWMDECPPPIEVEARLERIITRLEEK